jgi:hypothetical protein
LSEIVFEFSNKWTDVHEIAIRTSLGRSFSIEIHRPSYGGPFATEVLIRERTGPQPRTWALLVDGTTPESTAKDHFSGALDLVEKYLAQFAPADLVVDIHNPCNCAFVSEADQNAILAARGINKTVRIN